LQSLENI